MVNFFIGNIISYSNNNYRKNHLKLLNLPDTKFDNLREFFKIKKLFDEYGIIKRTSVSFPCEVEKIVYDQMRDYLPCQDQLNLITKKYRLENYHKLLNKYSNQKHKDVMIHNYEDQIGKEKLHPFTYETSYCYFDYINNICDIYGYNNYVRQKRFYKKRKKNNKNKNKENKINGIEDRKDYYYNYEKLFDRPIYQKDEYEELFKEMKKSSYFLTLEDLKSCYGITLNQKCENNKTQKQILIELELNNKIKNDLKNSLKEKILKNNLQFKRKYQRYMKKRKNKYKNDINRLSKLQEKFLSVQAA